MMLYLRFLIVCVVLAACLPSSTRAQDFQIRIDTTIGSKQGYSERVVIRLDSTSAIMPEMGGFDLLVQYNPSALSFQGAVPGDWLMRCGWEYFTYRYAWHGPCGDTLCPSGVLRIIAIAETNNGPEHPDCFGVFGPELTALSFVITNDPQFACQFIPIRFFWYECGDNSIASVHGRKLAISSVVIDAGIDISDGSIGWPTYTGAQDECLLPNDTSLVMSRNIDFINGGVDIACPDTYDVRLGDIDINRVANEIADNKLFRSYFVEGTKVFTLHVNSQAGATDLNQDGIILTLEDFVYQTRIIHDDRVPGTWYGLDRNIRLLLNNEMKTLTQLTDTTLGAMLITFNSESVVPTLHSPGMDIHYSSGDGVTYVLISSVDSANGFGNGDIISWTGTGYPSEIKAVMWAGLGVSVEMALPTDVEDGSGELLPSGISLHQNYPNPFNNATVISFELALSSNVAIDVLDLLGRTVWNSTGRYSPGIHSIDWPGVDKNGTEVASGMYFYRLTSDDFTETRKMLLVK